MNPVQLVYAIAGMTPTGRGSHEYWSYFSIVVDNLAYHKVVGIWGHEVGASMWSFYPGSYVHSMHGNKEIWGVSSGSKKIDQFVILYKVAEQHYWDNNSGHNYFLDVAAAERKGDYGVGTAVIYPPIIQEDDAQVKKENNGNHLIVYVAVQNLDYHKKVGIVYTTDGWQTWNNAFCSYSQSYLPESLPFQAQVETWKVEILVSSQKIEYAIFYIVKNNTYWDNNFGRNYQVGIENNVAVSMGIKRIAMLRATRAPSQEE